MIVLYCERSGPGLLAEPFNTFSNLAFLFAAWRAWIVARRLNALTTGTRFLIALVVCIGIGSTLFHSFAAEWANSLDLAPIVLFQLCYLWLYVRCGMGRGIGTAVGCIIALLAAVHLAEQFNDALNGSLLYAPALVLLGSLGLYHFQQKKQARNLLLITTGIFLVSLFFRTIDRAICPYLSLGTHFIWHLLNGLVLYLVMKALLLNIELHQGKRAENSPEDFTAA